MDQNSTAPLPRAVRHVTLLAMATHEVDVALVGGGLAGCVTALTLAARRPELKLLLVEAGSIGGNHTWSFHQSDISAGLFDLLRPALVGHWPCHRVQFASQERGLEGAYASLGSDAMARLVQQQVPVLAARATDVRATEVELANGDTIAARLVLDGRGAQTDVPYIGYQKFVGVELELAQPLIDAAPTLMDMTVDQGNDFRFVYTLPLTPTRLLVEDTYYSDSPALDRNAVAARALQYAEAHGWHGQIVRQEHGVLGLPGRGPVVTSPAVGSVSAMNIGYRGGWYHPTTGYSLPLIARVAELLAEQWDRADFPRQLRQLTAATQRQQRFALLLNRWLFQATPGPMRWNVMARFYQLPESLIARFYRLQLTPADQMRIVCGRPPKGTSVRKALQVSWS